MDGQDINKSLLNENTKFGKRKLKQLIKRPYLTAAGNVLLQILLQRKLHTERNEIAKVLQYLYVDA